MNDSKELDVQDFVAVSRGDNKAFERLFKRYYVVLCRYGNGFLGDPELAEDVVQDVFVYFWNHRERIELQVSLKAYLYTSVRHGALNVIHKQLLERRHYSLVTEFITHIETTDYSEYELENIEKVKQAMDRLPEQCRIVFMKSCVDGKKYKEIAEEMDISVNTVKTHIVKAHRLIREELGQISAPIFLYWLFGR